MDFLNKAFDNSRAKKLNKKLDKVLALDGTFTKMSDEELKQKSAELMQRAQKGENESKLMAEAFALMREATKRVLGMKQYPVQLKGAISIAEGNLAEMATGEGKTIVFPLAAYLQAICGKKVIIVTSNDYLAKRDSEQMSKLFGFLGMSVGLSAPQMSTEEKQKAYSCDVTYTTATELGFDYLRDSITNSAANKVLPPDLEYVSVLMDEVDFIILDEAMTPLIISKKNELTKEEEGFLSLIARFVETLEPCEEEATNRYTPNNGDYYYDPKNQLVAFSEKGIEKIEKFFKIDNLFEVKNIELVRYCNNALQAKVSFKKDVNYVVKDGKVQIVGNSTGRILDGRKYSDGIQQAIEAKEGVKITAFTKTEASITIQYLFKHFGHLGGLSGTCKNDEEELKGYGFNSVDKIETNKPLRRIDEHFHFYHTIDAKNQALKNRILELHESGRPILLGTTSVESSEEYAKILDELGLKYNILNAKNDEEESKIVAQAGQRGAITIATNMAGRGTDIQLGGNATFMATEEMEKLGFSRELISFADSYLQPSNEQEKQAREKFNELKSNFKKQTDAEKIDVMRLGGLAVIGTALNTSRRIDNQLRGRAGRQGEPGSSEIFVAWNDIRETFHINEASESEYLRLLAKRKIDIYGEITDDEVIATIENIQEQSEEQFKATRENIFKLSTPENSQRLALFAEKDDIIKICDEFDPEKVELCDTPSTKLEEYMFGLYQNDISKIVDNYYLGKQSADDFSNHKYLSNDDVKYATDYFFSQFAKYKCNIKQPIFNKYLKISSKKAVIQMLKFHKLDLDYDKIENSDSKEELIKNVNNELTAQKQKIKSLCGPTFEKFLESTPKNAVIQMLKSHKVDLDYKKIEKSDSSQDLIENVKNELEIQEKQINERIDALYRSAFVNYMDITPPNEIKDSLSIYALKLFKKSINESKEYYGNLKEYFKNNILSEYNEAWGSHLDRLDQAKFRLGISQITNQNAINDFCKDSYNFYQMLKDEVQSNIIEKTQILLCRCVLTTRALNEDKAKKAAQETQQNSQQQNQEQ